MTSFVRLCFRRPVTIGAVCVLGIVLAVLATFRLPVTLLPEVGFPAVTVWTSYPNVPPNRVERTVTEPIEKAIARTEGIRRITSRSELGGSLIEVQFDWKTNLDVALLSIRDQIDRFSDARPERAEQPVILRADPSDRPIMTLALQRADSPPSAIVNEAQNDLTSLRQIGQTVVARRLEQIEGVARVLVIGGHDRQIRVDLNPDRMARYDLSIDEVADALRRANATLPSGTIRRGPFRFTVEVSGEFKNVKDIEATVVRTSNAYPLRLSDVAEVHTDVADRRGLVRYQGREALMLLIERRPEANTIKTALDVRTALPPLTQEFPGIRLDVVVDESVFIEAAIDGVVQAVGIGGLFAVLVLLLFLRSRRSLTAVAVAVPLSIGFTLASFEILEITLNLIALSGLAIGVGLLVDNAIVVVENITRLREEGLPLRRAAQQGAEEVAGAITASTLTTACVFLPISLVDGLAGTLFRDQSLAVVAGIGSSLLVALSVVPLVLQVSSSSSGETKRTDRTSPWYLDRYESGLRWSLRHPGRVLGATAVLLAGASVLAWTLPREVIPDTYQNRLSVRMTMDPGVGLPLLSDRVRSMEAAARQIGASEILADVGKRNVRSFSFDPRPAHEAELTVVLPDDVTIQEASRFLPLEAGATDVSINTSPTRTRLETLLSPSTQDLHIDLAVPGRSRNAPIHAALASSPSANAVPGGPSLTAAVDTLLRHLQQEPALANVRRARTETAPAIMLRLNHEAMARFGVRPSEVATYLEAASQGQQATSLRRINQDVPIVLRADEATSVEDLLERHIPTATTSKPLRIFVRAKQTQLPSTLIRSGQTPVVRLLADIAPGGDLAAATAAVRTVLNGLRHADIRATINGENEDFRRSLRAMGWSLLFSLLLIYLILTAQFGQLLQPFVVLATVPLATAGVVLVLWATGQSVNVMSLTGCVVLVGIVVNDAIIKVDVINQRRRAGHSLRAAIESAGRDRVRPILMTTITTALGLLPLALGLGAGAEIRAPLAIAIIGGLCVATGLTLFVVPVLMYLASHEDRP